MNKIRLLLASFLWLISFYLFKKYILNILSENVQLFLMNAISWILSVVAILLVLIIIFGLIGYIWSNYNINKEKKKKFGEMVFYSIIILITAIISYSMSIVIHIDYLY